jgi:hypothetical protein
MTPTNNLCSQLREYNAWRRGNETLDQPSAAWVGAVIDEAADRLEELERELAESAQSLDFQTQLNREVIDLEKKTFAELAAERALADRLAGEIEKASPARLLFPWENEQSPSVDATEKPMP